MLILKNVTAVQIEPASVQSGVDIAIEGSCSYLSKEKRLADGVILQRLLVG